MSRVAVYPGSFDPVTRGHIDLIQRACRLFDRIIVAVSNNPAKQHVFSVDERMAMIEESIRGMKQVEVDTFGGLLVDYLRSKKVRAVIRGLRVVSDLDYEFQMAATNRRLYPDVETVFLMPDEQYTYLSASIIRQLAHMGAEADLNSFVTPAVSKHLRRKFKR